MTEIITFLRKQEAALEAYAKARSYLRHLVKMANPLWLLSRLYSAKADMEVTRDSQPQHRPVADTRSPERPAG